METYNFIRRHINHIYFMHWFVWVVYFISRKKNQRNRHTQSVWRIGARYRYNTFYRFHKANCNGAGNCITVGIYGCKQMAAKFPLSNYNKLVVFCFSRNISDADCIVYSKLSINQSSNYKPGEEFEG